MLKFKKNDVVTLQAIYQADLAKYQTISESNSSLDTKNGILLGATIAVGVFIFQKPLFTQIIQNCTDWAYGLFAIALVGTLSLLGAFAIGMHAIWPRKWHYPANTVSEQPSYLSKSGSEALLQLISDIESILPEIEGIMMKKGKLLVIGFILFGLATFLLVIVQQNI